MSENSRPHKDNKDFLLSRHITSTNAIEMLTIGNVKTENLEDMVTRSQLRET